jgi:hypothetical protein
MAVDCVDASGTDSIISNIRLAGSISEARSDAIDMLNTHVWWLLRAHVYHLYLHLLLNSRFLSEPQIFFSHESDRTAASSAFLLKDAVELFFR